MNTDKVKGELTAEELEAKRQQIIQELKGLEKLNERLRMERRKDFRLRIFHPVKWRRRHKNDPEWLKFEKENIGIKFVR